MMFQDIFFSIAKDVKNHPLPQRIYVPCVVESWGNENIAGKNLCAGLRIVYDENHASIPNLLGGIPFVVPQTILYEKFFLWDANKEEQCWKGGLWPGRYWHTARQHWQKTRQDILDVKDLSEDEQMHIEQTYGSDILSCDTLEEDILGGKACINLQVSPHVLQYTSTSVQETEKNRGLLTMHLQPLLI